MERAIVKRVDSPNPEGRTRQMKDRSEMTAEERKQWDLSRLRVKTLKALKKTSKEKQQVQTINCIDYSYDLYLIAFGGVRG